MKVKTVLLICSAFLLSVGTANGALVCKTDTIKNAVIDVEYKAKDTTGIIWKDELELARIISTLDGKGIRITLPNADPAKVIILDKTGKKKLKMISYVAPAIIDISDLRNGEYQLILQSHNVVAVKTFKKAPAKKKK